MTGSIELFAAQAEQEPAADLDRRHRRHRRRVRRHDRLVAVADDRADAGPGGELEQKRFDADFYRRAARRRALRVDDDAREDRLRRPAVLQGAAGAARRRRGLRVLRRRERAEGRLHRRRATARWDRSPRPAIEGGYKRFGPLLQATTLKSTAMGLRAGHHADRRSSTTPSARRRSSRRPHQGPGEVRRWRRLGVRRCSSLVGRAGRRSRRLRRRSTRSTRRGRSSATRTSTRR